MIFRKKKKPKYAKITSPQQIKSYIREFIFDTQLPDAYEASEALGCPPISLEVQEKHEDESEMRVERISELIPLLYGYAALFAAATADLAPHAFAESELDEKANPMAAKLLHAMDQTTKKLLEDSMSHLLIGAVSQLVDLEFVTLNGKKK
jgi:hypothetical protein